MAVGFSRDRWEEYLYDKLGNPLASAIVYQAKGKTIARVWDENQERWKRIAQKKAGVDDASVIQSALDSLTSGRTWKERVVLKGDFVIAQQLTLSSYLVLHVFGKMKLADGADVHMLSIPSDAKHIEIKYAHFDGNKANQTQNVNIINTIEGEGVLENITIKSCLFENAKYHALNTDDWENCLISNCKFVNGDYVPIRLHSTENVRVINNTIEAKGNVYAGIYIDGRNNVIAGNTIVVDNNAVPAIRYAPDGTYEVRGNRIVKNTLIGSSRTGLGIHVEGDYTHSNAIIGNKFYDFYIGISSLTENNKVIGNTFYNVDRGINIGSAAIGNIIKSNTFRGTSESPIDFAIRFYSSSYNQVVANQFNYCNYGYYEQDAADYNLIINNVFRNTTNPITIVGVNTIVRRNIGYTTENSGTATFSGDGSTTQFSIEHGLVSTPSKVQVTPMSSDAAGDFYVTADDTYIYINYSTAPPSGTDNVKVSWQAEV